MTKKLLMGNEAFAHAALEAGVQVVAGYPGTPSSELVETVARMHRAGTAQGVHVEWSTNEKAALEVCAGASLSGARSLFTCKQVGLNVASDALMSLNYIGVRGGLVLFVADDPGPISSQTEQDTRRFASFAKVPVLDPATPEQGVAMMKEAFELSESIGHPVILRPTTRVNHASTFFDVEDYTEARPTPTEGFRHDPSRWVIFPKRSRQAHEELNELLDRLGRDFSHDPRYSRFNPIFENCISVGSVQTRQRGSHLRLSPMANLPEDAPVPRIGIVAGGVSTQYAREALELLAREAKAANVPFPSYRFMQVGTPYPFPDRAAKRFLDGLVQILVLEELDSFIEEELLKLAGQSFLSARVHGKLTGDVPGAGELCTEDAARCIAKFFDMAKMSLGPDVMGLKKKFAAKNAANAANAANASYSPGYSSGLGTDPSMAGLMTDEEFAELSADAAYGVSPMRSASPAVLDIPEVGGKHSRRAVRARAARRLEQEAGIGTGSVNGADTENAALAQMAEWYRERDMLEQARYAKEVTYEQLVLRVFGDDSLANYEGLLPERPPVLCAGCPHRGSFYAVKNALDRLKIRRDEAVLCGDIGCYTLGNAAPLDAVDTCLCMGAGITMAQGVKVANGARKTIAFVGDSTFFASAMPGIANAAYNEHDVTFVVLDNSTTAMTGSQPHPGIGQTLMGTVSAPIDIHSVFEAMGIDFVIESNPLNLVNAEEAAELAISHEGPSAIIFKSPCVWLRPFGAPAEIDVDKCTGCKRCIADIGCPAITFSANIHGPKSGQRGQAVIDPDQCNGCGLCVQVCPFGAIRIPSTIEMAARGLEDNAGTVNASRLARPASAKGAGSPVKREGASEPEQERKSEAKSDRPRSSNVFISLPREELGDPIPPEENVAEPEEEVREERESAVQDEQAARASQDDAEGSASPSSESGDLEEQHEDSAADAGADAEAEAGDALTDEEKAELERRRAEEERAERARRHQEEFERERQAYRQANLMKSQTRASGAAGASSGSGGSASRGSSGNDVAQQSLFGGSFTISLDDDSDAKGGGRRA